MKIEFYNLKTIPSMLPCLSKFIGPKWYWNELFKLFLFVWRQSITNNSQFINRKLNGTSADTFRTKIYIHASKTSCQKCVSQGTTTTELEISMNQYLVWKKPWQMPHLFKTIDALKIFPKISFWFLDFPRFNINRFQEITEFVDTFAFSSCILVETVVTNI